MMANDLTEDAFQDALRLVRRRGEPPRPVATPLAAAAGQSTQKRSKRKGTPQRKGTPKHRRETISARITESKNTGEEGFLGTSENGDDLWVVEKLLGRRIRKKGKVSVVEYLCRWEGYPKYPDDWLPVENLNERLLQTAFQQFPGDESGDSQDEQGYTTDEDEE
jgi:hypothetical protein